MDRVNDHRICFVGDSFVQGTGDPLCLGWTGRLAVQAQKSGLNVTHYNLGVRRDTSQDIRTRWEKECENRLPRNAQQYVVFSFGANDSAIENNRRRISVAESRHNFREIISTAQSRYHTLIIGPPPVNDPDHQERIKELSQVFDCLSQELGVPYLSVFEPLTIDPVWMTELRNTDGCHPGDFGYAKLADLVGSWTSWWFRSFDAPKIHSS